MSEIIHEKLQIASDAIDRLSRHQQALWQVTDKLSKDIKELQEKLDAELKEANEFIMRRVGNEKTEGKNGGSN